MIGSCRETVFVIEGRCWPSSRPKVIEWRDWVSTARDPGSSRVFTVAWSNYGITEWVLSLTDSMSMMVLSEVSISIIPSPCLSLEVPYLQPSLCFCICNFWSVSCVSFIVFWSAYIWMRALIYNHSHASVSIIYYLEFPMHCLYSDLLVVYSLLLLVCVYLNEGTYLCSKSAFVAKCESRWTHLNSTRIRLKLSSLCRFVFERSDTLSRSAMLNEWKYETRIMCVMVHIWVSFWRVILFLEGLLESN